MTTSIEEPERIETGFLDGFIAASGAIVDAREYNLLLKTHLERFLTDADNVTVSTNVAALDRARSNDPDVIWLDQFTAAAGSGLSAGPVPKATTGDAVVADMVQSGFPAHDYWPPHVEDYELPEGRQLGAIVLWRGNSRRPLPTECIEKLRNLEHVIIALMVNGIARHRISRPLRHAFYDTLIAVRDAARLTPTEFRVLTLEALGKTQQDIADLLAVSPRTVRNHLKSVYHKTGTHGAKDFRGRFFTPRLD